MADLSTAQRKKLTVFVAIVVMAVATLWRVNRRFSEREAALSEGGTSVLRSGLERVAQAPSKLALTMRPGTPQERQLRHINAHLVGQVDVLVIGQSDADHMSQTFFRNDVHFYNAFISNSYLGYQYEAFRDVVDAQSVPQLVLFDVRSGLILVAGAEPRWEAVGDVWWAGAPYHQAHGPAPRWYKDIDSHLSLQQTEASFEALRAQTRWAEQTRKNNMTLAPGDADPDTGGPFEVVLAHAVSSSHRWLFDGSRVYPNEHDAILVPRGQDHVEEASGEREVNESRIAALDDYLARIVATGTTVIMYSPPLQPRVFEDARQTPFVRASSARVRHVAEMRDVDYCDLSLDANAVGCVPGDFYDELHISRHCNERVVRKLATGCAPRAGEKLRKLLSSRTLAN